MAPERNAYFRIHPRAGIFRASMAERRFHPLRNGSGFCAVYGPSGEITSQAAHIPSPLVGAASGAPSEGC